MSYFGRRPSRPPARSWNSTCSFARERQARRNTSTRTRRSASKYSAGEALTVSAGTLHTWWNVGAEEVAVRVQLTPAGRMEMFLETIYALAAAGRTNRKGVPHFLQLAVFAPAYFDTNHIVRPPMAIQRVVFGVVAPLARLLGYRPDYPYPYPESVSGSTAGAERQ